MSETEGSPSHGSRAAEELAEKHKTSLAKALRPLSKQSSSSWRVLAPLREALRRRSPPEGRPIL
jgi:hypothetical protein